MTPDIRLVSAVFLPLLALALTTTCGTRDTSEWPVSYQLEPGRGSVGHYDSRLISGRPAVCSVHGPAGMKKTGDFTLHYSRATGRVPLENDWRSVKITTVTGPTTYRRCALTEIDGRPVVVFSDLNPALRAAAPAETPVTGETDWQIVTIDPRTNPRTNVITIAHTLRVSGQFVFYSVEKKQNQMKQISAAKLELSGGELQVSEQTPLRNKVDSAIRFLLAENEKAEVDSLLLPAEPKKGAKKGIRRYLIARPELESGEITGWSTEELHWQSSQTISQFQIRDTGDDQYLALCSGGEGTKGDLILSSRNSDQDPGEWQRVTLEREKLDLYLASMATPGESSLIVTYTSMNYNQQVPQMSNKNLKYSRLTRERGGWKIADSGYVDTRHLLNSGETLLLSDGTVMTVGTRVTSKQGDTRHVLTVHLNRDSAKESE